MAVSAEMALTSAFGCYALGQQSWTDDARDARNTDDSLLAVINLTVQSSLREIPRILTSTCVSLPLDLCRITPFLSILLHRPDPPSEARGFLFPPLRLPLLCPSRTRASVLVTHHLVASSLYD